MKNASATDVKNRLGHYLNISIKEPVVIEKINKPHAVLMAYDEYERLIKIEDKYWAEQAMRAEKEGYAGIEKSMGFLLDSLTARV